MTEVKLSELTDRYFFCDPASGKKEIVRRVRARSAIVGVAVDALNRMFVIFTWAERAPTETLINKIIEASDAWRPRVFGIEANAMQSLFADAVGLEALHRGKRLPLLPVTQPTKIDKDWRIRTALQPVIADGRLFIQPGQLDLKAELASFPMTPTKDIVDALASAVSLVPHRPTRRQHDDELAERLAYLRDSGADPQYIRDVAEGRVA